VKWPGSARRWQLRKSRRRYASAKTATEKKQILQKVVKVAPTTNREQFLTAIKSKG